MKTCYLHVGFHKTATTTFQQICGKNRDTLKESGFFTQVIFPQNKGNRWTFGPLSMIYKRGKAKAQASSPANRGGKHYESNQKHQMAALRQDHDPSSVVKHYLAGHGELPSLLDDLDTLA